MEIDKWLVTVSVKSRVVKVEGPRGAITKSFKHLNLDIYLTGTKKNLSMKVDLWLGSKVEAAAIRTVCSHVKNMITGVTRVRYYPQHLKKKKKKMAVRC